MRNKQFRLSYILVIILIGGLVVGLGFTNFSRKVPKDVYQVYLEGKVIGIIDDDKEFDNYINNKEEAIKEKYGVDKVYMPKEVNIKPITLYEPVINSYEEVYQKIVKMEQFTINGTIVTIKNEDVLDYETKYIYVLNKDIFDGAIDNLIRSFVDEEEYEAYMAGRQKAIVDTGSIINDIDIDNINFKNMVLKILKLRHTLFFSQNLIRKRILN